MQNISCFVVGSVCRDQAGMPLLCCAKAGGQVGHRSSEATRGRHQKDDDLSAQSLVLHLGSAQWVSRHSALSRERSGLTTFGHRSWVRWAV